MSRGLGDVYKRQDKEGIGIGLYLAREIITLQNGYIEVQSQIGQGSKFIIYLPNRD